MSPNWVWIHFAGLAGCFFLRMLMENLLHLLSHPKVNKRRGRLNLMTKVFSNMCQYIRNVHNIHKYVAITS